MREKETRLLLHRRHSPGNSSSFFCHSELEKSILADVIVRFIHLRFFLAPCRSVISAGEREREIHLFQIKRGGVDSNYRLHKEALLYCRSITRGGGGEGEQFLVRIERMIDLLSCTSKMEEGRAVPPVQMQYRVCQ